MLKENKLLIKFILFLCLIGCKNKNASEEQLDKENYNEHQIDFLNASILLPKEYEKIETEELEFNLIKKAKDFKEVEYIKSSIKNITNVPFGYMIFAEKDGYSSHIFIRKGEYVPLNKQLANQYLGMVRSQVEESWAGIGINYKRLENKFITTNKSKIIKIKYLIELEGEVNYHTQFLITSKSKTFDFLIVNSKNVDLENLIKRINVR